MYDAKARYKDKLIEIDQCIDLMMSEPKLLPEGAFIELMKLHLEVEKELYRLECEKK